MPTEENKIEQGKLFIQTKEDEEPKELKAISISTAENNKDDVIDTMRYEEEGVTSEEMSITIKLSKEQVRQILKLYGLERITRKRFKKLLMGCGMQRNYAEIVAIVFQKSKIQYTPLAVKKVIETINAEAEKDRKVDE